MNMREIINIVEARRPRRQVMTGLIEATSENVAKAKAFIMRKWIERAKENGWPEPEDLSKSCKFSSMFAQRIFGGRLEGNWDHQYVRLQNGNVLDLNDEAADVKALSRPHHHDMVFWGNPDHHDSMKSCLPRVEQWVQEFMSEVE